MKRIAFLLALSSAITIGTGLAASAETTDDAALKDQLIALEKKSWEAWKNRDSKFFQEFLTDDHVEAGFGGVSNKAEIVPFVGSPASPLKRYRLDHLEM